MVIHRRGPLYSEKRQWTPGGVISIKYSLSVHLLPSPKWPNNYIHLSAENRVIRAYIEKSYTQFCGLGVNACIAMSLQAMGYIYIYPHPSESQANIDTKKEKRKKEKVLPISHHKESKVT